MIFHRFPQMLRCALILFSPVSFGLVALGQDRTIHLDIGINDQQTLATGWNNMKGVPGLWPTATINLVDSTGAVTGITLVPSWSVMNVDTGINGTAANYDGPYPAEVTDIPASALRDGAFVRDGQTLTLTLNNLPANTSYSFLFYGTTANIGDYSLFTVNGGNNGQDFIDDLVNNDDQVAIVDNILPNAMQKIAVLFDGRLPNGMPQLPAVNDDGWGRFNYMRIIQHVLPPGDYNGDTMVTADDYDAWRTSFGSDTNLAADGNDNGVVDAADYAVWRNAMTPGGSSLVSHLTAVPEPVASTMFGVAIIGWWATSARRAGRRS